MSKFITFLFFVIFKCEDVKSSYLNNFNFK